MHSGWRAEVKHRNVLLESLEMRREQGGESEGHSEFPKQELEARRLVNDA